MTACPRPPVLDPRQAHLRVLATSDLHMHLLPWDYFGDRPDPGVGLARTAALIAEARAGAANALLVDNGDILQGTPMGDLLAERAAARGGGAGTGHPMIAAMNLLGYDAATLGNHEFNYGLGFLMGALSEARFPVVSANVATRLGHEARQDRTLLPPYVLLDRVLTDAQGLPHPIRIGVLGLLPPQITVWDRDLLHGRVETRDMVETAAAYLPQMREAGAELVIALAHSGIGEAGAGRGRENVALALAALPGIDAVVAGHSHEVFPSPVFANRAGIDLQAGTLAGKPATMPGAFGSHLGVIDLVLDRGRGGWQVARGQGRTLRVNSDPAASPPDDGRVAATVRRAHAATLRVVRRPVGYSALPLNTHFAMVAPVPAVTIVAEAKRRHVVDALRGTAWADLPVLATAAPHKAGGRGGPGCYTDVPAGPLAERHVADLYAFPNTISAVLVTGDLLAAWLERAASAFRRLQPGVADQMLLDTDFPTTGFDLVVGLTYEFDLSQPARFAPGGDLVDPDACRVRAIRHGGRPIRPEDRFILATNSYRASGGARFPGAGPDRIVYSAPLRNREILRRHIAAMGRIEAGPDPEPVWRFAPMPGTSALFDTSPRAQWPAGDRAGPDIEPAGPGAGGFARFRIRF